jgi:hypothetical protein
MSMKKRTKKINRNIGVIVVDRRRIEDIQEHFGSVDPPFILQLYLNNWTVTQNPWNSQRSTDCTSKLKDMNWARYETPNTFYGSRRGSWHYAMIGQSPAAVWNGYMGLFATIFKSYCTSSLYVGVEISYVIINRSSETGSTLSETATIWIRSMSANDLAARQLRWNEFAARNKNPIRSTLMQWLCNRAMQVTWASGDVTSFCLGLRSRRQNFRSSSILHHTFCSEFIYLLLLYAPIQLKSRLITAVVSISITSSFSCSIYSIHFTSEFITFVLKSHFTPADIRNENVSLEIQAFYASFHVVYAGSHTKSSSTSDNG